MKLRVGHKSRIHKHTHGQGKLYALPPFYGGGIQNPIAADIIVSGIISHVFFFFILVGYAVCTH